jgi:alpha-mannosidase
MPSYEEEASEAESPAQPQRQPQPAEDLRDAQPGEGWSVVSLIAHDSIEPPASLDDHEAVATWCAVSAAWHPAVLAVSSSLPRIEPVEYPSSPGAREAVIVPEGLSERLPSGFRTQAEDAGAVVFEAGVDRQAVLDALVDIVSSQPLVRRGQDETADAIVLDFLAIGTAAWMLRDLTVAMNHSDGLDHENLTREVLAGARAWASGDYNTARNRLRASFEVLTQARERFYPVDAYVVDLCLLDPSMPAGVLADPLDARVPVTLLAPARAIEAQARSDPDNVARVREAITEGWADVAGGAYTEADEPLLPVESILWQFRHGGAVYREHLDGRNVETVARRRFGLYPMLPQIGKRFGYRFAIHLGFDAGRFPVRSESKRLWESPDHTNLETLTRPPLAADRPSQGVLLPWRLAATLKNDHVATLPLVHWPGQVAGWYRDLRRVAAYSPVLARWVTLNDYFHLTDRPFEVFAPEPDEYVTPYLAQAVARKDPAPISRRATHARLRARFDALAALAAMAEALRTPPADAGAPLPDVETLLETDRLDEADMALTAREPAWAAAVAQGVVGAKPGGRPGFLVINPAPIARRVSVLLPDAALDLRPEGPLRAAQFTDEGVWGTVELPALGFAWVPRDTNFEASPAPVGTLSVRDRMLRNESIAVEIDSATGGIRGVKAAGEDTARLGQQLVIAGADGSPSKMKCTAFEVEYGGPSLVQAVSKGTINGADGRILASFRQRYRLWTGRPILELDITLNDLDATWLASIADADPWMQYLACRWAWPDPSSMLRRTCLLAPELTEADRPETPDALDISTRRQRTALLFGGLAHHKRHGTRMLDTLLVAGREQARSFRLGVALDLEYPFHAAVDLLAPAYIVPTDTGPPRNGPTGWLIAVDHAGVAITHMEHVASSDDSRGWGIVFHALETAGRPARCRLRTFRNPTWARQTDFQGETIVDLPIDNDAVLLDLTPRELARIEVTLG